VKLVEAYLARLAILDWTDAVTFHYARIRAALERAGKPIGNLDLMIASHAVAVEATVVTNNVRHFASVPGSRSRNGSEVARRSDGRQFPENLCPRSQIDVRDHPHHRAIDRFAARTRNAGVIEQNNRQVRGKSVGDRRIPMIHAGTKVWHKDQSSPISLPNR